VRKGDKVRLQVQARYEQLGSQSTTTRHLLRLLAF
jgi:hypothetical protein